MDNSTKCKPFIALAALGSFCKSRSTCFGLSGPLLRIFMKTDFYWRCLFALVASAISIRRRIASGRLNEIFCFAIHMSSVASSGGCMRTKIGAPFPVGGGNSERAFPHRNFARLLSAIPMLV
jgi:hypothetical protein